MDVKVIDMMMEEYTHERKNCIVNKKQSLKNYLTSDNAEKIVEIKKRLTNEEINEIKSFELIKNKNLPPAPQFSKKPKKYTNGELKVFCYLIVVE